MHSQFPTILSRCQKIYFPNLTDSDLKKFALNRTPPINIDETTLQLSHGSVSNLLNIVDLDKANEIKKMITSFYKNDLGVIEKNLESINKKDKKDIFDYLNNIKISTKDLYILSNEGSNQIIHYKFLLDFYHLIQPLEFQLLFLNIFF